MQLKHLSAQHLVKRVVEFEHVRLHVRRQVHFGLVFAHLDLIFGALHAITRSFARWPLPHNHLLTVKYPRTNT